MDNFRRILRVPPHKTLRRVDFRDKRVLVRVDLNVPIENATIEDLRRINSAVPTIKKVIERGAKEVNIITHFGRPQKKEDKFSTKIIARALSKLLRAKGGIEVKHNKSDSPALDTFYQILPNVRVFENLRFDKGEEKNSKEFAKEIAKLGDCLVQDAFANIHRQHASMMAICDELPVFVGLLVEKEINALYKILYNPEHPFIAIIGGAKIEDKLGVITSLSKRADAVLIGGMTANEWILDNHPVSENIYLPTDGINKNGAIVEMIPEAIKNGVFDIGPETIMLYKSVLSNAKTIFWNGNLGVTEDKKFVHGTNEITRFIVKLKAEKVASGGNTAEVIDELNLADQFDFISTGGGATSDLIAGKKMPVIDKLLGSK
ncbi:MAG: phosphoglycerate kinase [bacterium]